MFAAPLIRKMIMIALDLYSLPHFVLFLKYRQITPPPNISQDTFYLLVQAIQTYPGVCFVCSYHQAKHIPRYCYFVFIVDVSGCLVTAHMIGKMYLASMYDQVKFSGIPFVGGYGLTVTPIVIWNLRVHRRCAPRRICH